MADKGRTGGGGQRAPVTVKNRVRWPGEMAKVKDPVCGMMVETERAPAKGTYDGQTVYFCHEICKKTYEAKRKPK